MRPLPNVNGMYVPAAFAEHDPEVIDAIIAANPLGNLVVLAEGTLVATPVPMMLRIDSATGERRVIGHLAKANPALVAGPALALFTGVDAYVTPSSYRGKVEHGKVVPTWNYEAVQIRGELVVHTDAAWIIAVVTELTNSMERSQPRPWSVSDAPTDYIDSMVRAIVGFELIPTTVTAKRKLSQNRAAEDQAGVRSVLAAGTPAERAVAEAMNPPVR